MERSSPRKKDCFDVFDTNKYEQIGGAWESGDLVVYKSKVYIAKKNGSSTFIYASYSDMKENRKQGSPSTKSVTKIRQKSPNSISTPKTPSKINTVPSPISPQIRPYSASNSPRPNEVKVERNLFSEFVQEEPLRIGDFVSIFHEPTNRYYKGQVKNTASSAVTVNYVGYSPQAIETIPSDQASKRLSRGYIASGFKEGDLAFLTVANESYHVVIKDLSDWIWVENYDKPDLAEWIQISGLNNVLSCLSRADLYRFFGFKKNDKAVVDFNNSSFMCTVNDVTTQGVHVSIDGREGSLLLDYQMVQNQLSKVDSARIFRSNQIIDSPNVILALNGIGFSPITASNRIKLRTPEGPLTTFSIIEATTNQLKLKIWDLGADGKIEAAFEREHNGTAASSEFVKIAALKRTGAQFPKVQVAVEDNWQLPYWRDIAAQHPLSHIKHGASWNVSQGKYGLYTPKLNWTKEKDNFLRQNEDEQTILLDLEHEDEPVMDRSADDLPSFALSVTKINPTTLAKTTPPVIIQSNKSVFQQSTTVQIRTDKNSVICEQSVKVLSSRRISFHLPTEQIAQLKPSIISVLLSGLIGHAAKSFVDFGLTIEFRADDSIFTNSFVQPSYFPKEYSGRTILLDLDGTSIIFSVPLTVYQKCKQHARSGPFELDVNDYVLTANEEQNNEVKHWIFNPSHNRASQAILDYSATEEKKMASYTQVIVVRSGVQFEQYKKIWGSTHIIMALPLHYAGGSDTNGVGFARKIVIAVADRLLLKRIWMLDDNVYSFYKFNLATSQYEKCHLTTVLKSIEAIFNNQSSPQLPKKEKYSANAVCSLLPKGEYFDIDRDGPHSQNAIVSHEFMKTRLDKISSAQLDSPFMNELVGNTNNYGVIGIARCGRFQHVYKKPFVRDQVYSCVLINLEAIRAQNQKLKRLQMTPISYPDYPIFEDMKFNDICDFNGLWVVKSNRFLHRKIQTREISKDSKKIEWRKYFVSSFDLYSKKNEQISRIPFKSLNVRKFASISDLKYMIERHEELGVKQFGLITRIHAVTERDNILSLGHSLKDSNIMAKVFHTNDEELDDKIHKIYVEFEHAKFDDVPTQQLYFDSKYCPPETAQLFSPIPMIIVHGSLGSNVMVELITDPPLTKRMILPLTRTAVFKNIVFDKPGTYKFRVEAKQTPPLIAEATYLTRVIDIQAAKSSEYFQQGLRLSVKLEECDEEVKRRWRSSHEYYESTWPNHRATFVRPTVPGSHLRICQYLAYVCFLDHLHRKKSNSASIVKLPTGAGKTVLGCLLPFLAAKNKVLVLTTSPLISREFKKALVGSRKRNEISMFERYNLLNGNLPKVALFTKKSEKLKEMTTLCQQANYIVCNYQKLTQGKEIRSNGMLVMLSRLHIDMIIIDEGHHDAADSYKVIYGLFPGAKRVLLTATPFRTDQKELGGDETAQQIFQYSIQDALKAKIIKDISHVTVCARNMELQSSLLPERQTKKKQRVKTGPFTCARCKKHGFRKEYDETTEMENGSIFCEECKDYAEFDPKFSNGKQSNTVRVNENTIRESYYPMKQFTQALLGQESGGLSEEMTPSVKILIVESLKKLEEKRKATNNRVWHKIIVYCDSIEDTKTVKNYYSDVAVELFKNGTVKTFFKAAAFHSNADSEKIDRIEQHQVDIVVQSKKLGEGYDHKEFTIAVIIGSKIKSLSKYIQFVGRIMRRLASGAKEDNQALIYIHDGLQFEKLWHAYKNEDSEVAKSARLSNTDTQYKIVREEHYLALETLANSDNNYNSSINSSAYK